MWYDTFLKKNFFGLVLSLFLVVINNKSYSYYVFQPHPVAMAAS